MPSFVSKNDNVQIVPKVIEQVNEPYESHHSSQIELELVDYSSHEDNESNNHKFSEVGQMISHEPTITSQSQRLHGPTS